MSLESPGSVTHWLSLLRAGDPQAPEALWDRYFAQVLRLAHQQLLGLRDRSHDAEDVALSTLNALCQAAQHGRLANVQDRHDLWRLLVTCTLNRARNLRSHENRLKRRAELVAETGPRPEAGLGNVPSTEPTPEEAALLQQSRARPILVAEAVNIDPSGAVVDVTFGRYAAGRVQLVVHS